MGQEPVIFLKDLNFEILKAMVEFMYCGETRISYQLLSPLLTATKKFKVGIIIYIIIINKNYLYKYNFISNKIIIYI